MSRNERSESGENSNDNNNEEINTPTNVQTRAAKSRELLTARVRNLPEPHE